MIKVAAQKPAERQQYIQRSLNEYAKLSQDPTVAAWKMKIDSNMVEVRDPACSPAPRAPNPWEYLPLQRCMPAGSCRVALPSPLSGQCTCCASGSSLPVAARSQFRPLWSLEHLQAPASLQHSHYVIMAHLQVQARQLPPPQLKYQRVLVPEHDKAGDTCPQLLPRFWGVHCMHAATICC